MIIVFFLMREPDPVTLRLSLRRHDFSSADFRKMLQIGIPAGLQGMVFSISNIFIQSSINSFGSDAVAGSATALTYEAYCYYIVVGFNAAAIAFTGQNYGAGRLDRCRRVGVICMMMSVGLCALANIIIVWQEKFCIGVFTSDPNVARYAMMRFHTVLVYQCLASSYEVAGSYMRGFGRSVTPMVLTIFGTCVLRLVWVGSVVRFHHTFEVLMMIYPITWIITGVMVVVAALVLQRRLSRVGRTDGGQLESC